METSVQTKEGALSLLEEHGEQIRGFGVRRLGLFGSFSRGEQDATSDIDFVVEFRGERRRSTTSIGLQCFWRNCSRDLLSW